MKNYKYFFQFSLRRPSLMQRAEIFLTLLIFNNESLATWDDEALKLFIERLRNLPSEEATNVDNVTERRSNGGIGLDCAY